MHPITSDFGLVYPSNYLPVMLDGILLGYIDNKLADQLVKSLRALKIQQLNSNPMYESVPKTLEVAYLPPSVEISEDESANPETEEQSSA